MDGRGRWEKGDKRREGGEAEKEKGGGEGERGVSNKHKLNDAIFYIYFLKIR